MSHAHTLIRAAAVTALTGLATTASRVYANRQYPLADANLPGLRVFLNDENVEPITVHAPVIYERTVQLVVECCAKDNATLDASCDQMQLEVEIVLAAGLTVDGQHLDAVLAASRYDFEAAATPVGVKRVFFNIGFNTLATTPDSLT
jgi:hypothetical protein